ncbi:MAG: metalloregulator ArsR/SmtB family transcription factor [Fimbriimonadaceae bacterium]
MSVYEELAEESRRRILSCLLNGPRNVSEIVGATGLKQPNVSNHLARMRSKGVVVASKLGRQVFYSLASPDVQDAVRKALDQQPARTVSMDIHQAIKEYSRAAIQGDRATCQEIVEHYGRANTPLEDIYQYLLGPAMETIGTWYKVGAIDEGQEHMASAITERMMAHVVSMRPAIRRIDKSAVLGCAPNNWHAIGLRMISDVLRVSGWETYYLGANVPAEAFLSAAQRHRPDLVLVSVSTPGTEDEALELVGELAAEKARNGYTLGAGGAVVAMNVDRFFEKGIDFTAPNLRDFARVVLPEIERSGRAPEAYRAPAPRAV